ncbi:hypothetical protein FACS1894159_02570 [Bacteroidia bacterium]|nr:hypothetical protein FACS1894159_02570 [Bacteroidia bacterium]
MFIHTSYNPSHPEYQVKPLIFLNSITCEDWDEASPTSSRTQIENKYQELCTYDKVYFIDRNEFTSTSLTVVEVVPLKKVPLPY